MLKILKHISLYLNFYNYKLRLVPWLLEAVKGQKLANFLFIISRTMLIKKPRLNQRGKEASFYYPQKADILVVLYSDILTTVDATTNTGRTYNLSKKCQDVTTAALKKRL